MKEAAHEKILAREELEVIQKGTKGLANLSSPSGCDNEDRPSQPSDGPGVENLEVDPPLFTSQDTEDHPNTDGEEHINTGGLKPADWTQISEEDRSFDFTDAGEIFSPIPSSPPLSPESQDHREQSLSPSPESEDSRSDADMETPIEKLLRSFDDSESIFADDQILRKEMMPPRESQTSPQKSVAPTRSQQAIYDKSRYTFKTKKPTEGQHESAVNETGPEIATPVLPIGTMRGCNPVSAKALLEFKQKAVKIQDIRRKRARGSSIDDDDDDGLDIVTNDGPEETGGDANADVNSSLHTEQPNPPRKRSRQLSEASAPSPVGSSDATHSANPVVNNKRLSTRVAAQQVSPESEWLNGKNGAMNFLRNSIHGPRAEELFTKFKQFEHHLSYPKTVSTLYKRCRPILMVASLVIIRMISAKSCAPSSSTNG